MCSFFVTKLNEAVQALIASQLLPSFNRTAKIVRRSDPLKNSEGVPFQEFNRAPEVHISVTRFCELPRDHRDQSSEQRITHDDASLRGACI